MCGQDGLHQQHTGEGALGLALVLTCCDLWFVVTGTPSSSTRVAKAIAWQSSMQQTD
jgi:hypothetical protein